MDIFPNLKWLPSTSADPRESHRVFWNRIWAKTDPFWNTNQPGNLWNCKCDWHETDEPPTDGNPAKTGKIFSDDCSYVKRLKPESKAIVENYVKPVMEHCKEYIKYKNDADYKDVKFDWETGGVMATHIKHNFAKVGGEYEKDVQSAGFHEGHSVIFTSEQGKPDGEKYTEGIWDGLTFEIGTSCGTGKNNIKKILQHCYHKRAQIAVINFKDERYFSVKRLETGINEFYKYCDYQFEHIIYVVNDKIYYYK